MKRYEIEYYDNSWKHVTETDYLINATHLAWNIIHILESAEHTRVHDRQADFYTHFSKAD